MGVKHFLIGNWKMNLGSAKAGELASQLASMAKTLKHSEVWIAPSFTSIQSASIATKNSNIKLGGQNVHWEEKGAFTGEVSIPMLKELNCSFVIVGHSERRKYFGENNNIVARRASAALRANLFVAYCVGETLEERARGLTEEIIREQLDPVLYHLRDGEERYLVISYEPAWAIGSGNVAPIEEIEKVHNFIQLYWKDTVSSKLKSFIPPILYGGSVAPDNFSPIIKSKYVQGALIGGASLDFDKFNALVQLSEQAGTEKV